MGYIRVESGIHMEKDTRNYKVEYTQDVETKVHMEGDVQKVGYTRSGKWNTQRMWKVGYIRKGTHTKWDEVENGIHIEKDI